MWKPHQDIVGLDEAQDIIRANTSPRYKRLAWLESWVEGRQYDGMPSWWDDRCPLWERAPCIVYPVVEVAIGSNTDLILGEGRFPSFSAAPDEDEADEESGLGEDASDTVDRLLRDYHRQTRFRSHARDAFRAAQACGTAVAIHGARNGRPFNELVPARWCTPKFDLDERVTSLEIRYPFIDVVKDRNGKWRAVVKLYRRTLDEAADTVYLPAEANKHGDEPAWVKDSNRTAAHGLGFCPVVWYPFMRGCGTVNEIDGKPVHRNLTDEIHQFDIARSQWHRGALHSEPQTVEIGVKNGYNPTGTGRAPILPSHEPKDDGMPEHLKGSPRTGDGHGYISAGAGQPARKKGPGYVWQYDGDKQTVDVKQLTYPGDALKAQQDNCSDLFNKLQEALAVVLLDPNNIKFAATTSGKALEAIKQRQIDRCSIYRDDLADGFLLPSVDMQLRIVSKLGSGLRVSKAAEAQRALAKFAEAA